MASASCLGVALLSLIRSGVPDSNFLCGWCGLVQVVGSILTYLTRTRQYHTRSYQYELMMKKNELYYLLALALALTPQGNASLTNDQIEQALHDKVGDKIQRINRGYVLLITIN